MTQKSGWVVCVLVLGAMAVRSMAQPAVVDEKPGPRALYVDDRLNPLGIDDPAPRFSWQIQDVTRGARQTAYEIQVASSVDWLGKNKANVWDSGRIESGVT